MVLWRLVLVCFARCEREARRGRHCGGVLEPPLQVAHYSPRYRVPKFSNERCPDRLPSLDLRCGGSAHTVQRRTRHGAVCDPESRSTGRRWRGSPRCASLHCQGHERKEARSSVVSRETLLGAERRVSGGALGACSTHSARGFDRRCRALWRRLSTCRMASVLVLRSVEARRPYR